MRGWALCSHLHTGIGSETTDPPTTMPLAQGTHRPGKPRALHMELQHQRRGFIPALPVQHCNLCPHLGAEPAAKSSETLWYLRPFLPHWGSASRSQHLSCTSTALLQCTKATRVSSRIQAYILPLDTRSSTRSSGADSSLPWPYQWWGHALLCPPPPSPGWAHQAGETLPRSHVMLAGKVPHAKECHQEAVFTCSSRTSM